MCTIRGAWSRLLLHWEAGLRRLPFFTQRTAVLVLGALVATLAMLGGVVALVGWPGASGPAHLVPGERAGQAPESRPEPGDRPAPGPSGAGVRSGADAGGATAASPSPANQSGDPTIAVQEPRSPGPGATAAGSQGSGGGTTAGAQDPGGATTRAQGSGGSASGAQGSGGAAGAGAGGPPAAPPTTSPPTTIPQGPLGPVVSTLLP